MAVRKSRLAATGFLGFSALAAMAAAAVGGERPKPVLRDVRKTTIEDPTKAVVAGKFVNPKAEPGKVKWHPSFTAACAAARTSRRPVLLFQMMGKLDEQFC